MRHHDDPRERFKRFLCRVFGHRWHQSGHGEPVVPVIDICKRCGKFERSVFVRGKS